MESRLHLYMCPVSRQRISQLQEACIEAAAADCSAGPACPREVASQQSGNATHATRGMGGGPLHEICTSGFGRFHVAEQRANLIIAIASGQFLP